MLLPAFSAACRACSASFTAPREPEEASLFLARGANGGAFAVVDAMKCPAWDFIAEVADGLNAGDRSRKTVEGFLEIVARCLDPAGGPWTLGGGPACPACGSPDVRVDEDVPAGEIDAPPASFAAFMSRPVAERADEVRRRWREWKELPAYDV